MPPYKKYKKLALTNSIELAYSGISLPTGISITKKEVKYICFEIEKFLSFQ